MSKKPENVEVGKKVRAIRESLGLTRPELAGRIGISAVTLKNAELGITKLGDRTLRDIKRYEAKRMERNGIAKDKGPYTSESVSGNVEDIIRMTVALTSDNKIKGAAKAMADALGIPLDQAITILVRESMKAPESK